LAARVLLKAQHDNYNPWLVPAQVEVEGECDVFTGRIVADDWAGRPIKTKHGVRYQASTRPIRFPGTVRVVVVEAWQPGTRPDAPKLQEIPEKADQETHMLPAVTFTASQRGEEGVKTLGVRDAKSLDFQFVVAGEELPMAILAF